MKPPYVCLGCKQEINGRVVWLAEDYRKDGGQIDGPYPLHATCADAPWPLFELTEAEADRLEAEKQAKQ